MKTVRFATLLGLLLVIFTFGCESGKKRVNIRYKFKPDMTLKYEQTSKGSVRVVAGDSVIQDSYNDITTTLTWKVEEITDDQTAKIVETKEFHSRMLDRRDSSLTDTVEPGAGFTLYIKPNGKLVDIIPAAEEMQGVASYIQKYFEQGAPMFPDDDVDQGYSWNQSSTIVLPDGPIEANTKFTVKSFARHHGYDCVVIAYEGNLAIPLEPYEYKDHKTLDGYDLVQSTGHQYFAYKEGFIVENLERYVVDGQRKRVMLNTGDTVLLNVSVEYDVDQLLQSVEMPPVN